MTRNPTLPTDERKEGRKPLEDPACSLAVTSRLAMAYAELATDTDREAEADEWCEALIGDGLAA